MGVLGTPVRDHAGAIEQEEQEGKAGGDNGAGEKCIKWEIEEALGLILLGHVYSQMQVSVFQKAAARHYLFGVCVLVDMHIYRLFLLHLVTCVSARWFCVCMTIMNHITFLTEYKAV